MTADAGTATIPLRPGPKTPTIVVRVRRDDSSWRLLPASYVVKRDGQTLGRKDDIDL